MSPLPMKTSLYSLYWRRTPCLQVRLELKTPKHADKDKHGPRQRDTQTNKHKHRQAHNGTASVTETSTHYISFPFNWLLFLGFRSGCVSAIQKPLREFPQQVFKGKMTFLSPTISTKSTEEWITGDFTF